VRSRPRVLRLQTEGAVEERVTSITLFAHRRPEHLIDCGTIPMMGRRGKEKTDAGHYVFNKSHCYRRP
jgi:hypothetical protein